MPDINVFYTPPVQATTTATSSSFGKTGQVSDGSINFFDMIFARVAEIPAEQTALTKTIAEEVTADHPANDLTAMIAVLPETGLEESGLDLEILPEGDLQGQAVAAITLDAAGVKKLQTILNSLMEGIPADQRPVALNISGKFRDGQWSKELESAMVSLGIDVTDIDAASQSLIATGLSPEELTALMSRIQDSANQQAFLLGTVQIVEDGDASQTIFLPKTLILGKSGEPKQAEKISSTLTALTAPDTGDAAPAAGMEISAEGTKSIREARFDDILKMLELSQAKASDARGGAALGSQADHAANPAPAAAITGQNGPANSSIAANSAGLGGAFMDNNAVDGVFPEGSDWSGNDTAISNARITGTAQLTSLVTHARDATQPHPATMYVAATLAKGAKDGEAKSMTLRMDPPELGKIEIHMHFTKNKEMKAHMVFEKPETMLMMQRDSQMLERSLQESGLGGNALSFELAGQDHDFGNSQNRNGNDYGKGGKAGTDEMDVIETTMGWTVDQNTGLQHYNILA